MYSNVVFFGFQRGDIRSRDLTFIETTPVCPCLFLALTAARSEIHPSFVDMRVDSDTRDLRFEQKKCAKYCTIAVQVRNVKPLPNGINRKQGSCRQSQRFSSESKSSRNSVDQAELVG